MQNQISHLLHYLSDIDLTTGAAKVPREAAQQSDRARAREQGPRGTQGGNSI